MDLTAVPWLAFTLLILQTVYASAKDKDLYCGACHMLVDVIDWEISQTDPKKTIQVGSFRIMPDGTQKLSEIPFKRSGVQISELMDTACSKPNDYYQTSEQGSERKVYKRQQRRDKQASSLTNLVISKDNLKMLKFSCEGIAEDHEDEIIDAFKNGDDESYLHTICVDITDACTEDMLYDVNPTAHDIEEMEKKAQAEKNKLEEEKRSNEQDDEDEEDESDDDNSGEDDSGEDDSDIEEDSMKDEL